MRWRICCWLGAVWLVVGCTVPDFDDVTGGKQRACNAEHPCGQGFLCVQEACVEATCDGAEAVAGYRDEDADGFAAPGAAYEIFCGGISNGYVTQGGDCDDANKDTYPGAPEKCDGRDNDCREGIDNGLPQSSLADFFLDADGDGVGAGVAVRACAPPPRHVSLAGDCDDGNSARTPGKLEVCDDLDNDCDNAVDEELAITPFYRDADGDGFGAEANMLRKCRAPAGYVPPTASFDCNDADLLVNPGAREKCNGVDDNCAGGADEGFANSPGTPCSNGACTGQFVCDTAQTGTVCNAPTQVDYYADADGDGEGSQRPQDALHLCASNPPSTGYVTTSTDCDDWDPYNRSGGLEVCDDRDNNCSNEKDEGAVCGGRGWRELTSPAVPNVRDWNTVALGAGGSPVWIAGEAGALAFRASASANFTEIDASICGAADWNAAWVRPSDGQVFLAGDAGKLAAYTRASPATCTLGDTVNAPTTPSTRNLLGITGFESAGVTTVYAVNDQGAVYAWTPGSNPVFKVKRSTNDSFRDIQGVTPSKLLIVGDRGLGPEVEAYDSAASSGGLSAHAVSSIPSGNTGLLYGVSVIGTTRAYAVGQNGLLLKWDGDSTWNFVSPNATMQLDLTSVAAFDDFSVYATDATGRIRRPRATDWFTHFTTTGGVALDDIAASSRGDIWAVGNGRVVHFPE